MSDYRDSMQRYPTDTIRKKGSKGTIVAVVIAFVVFLVVLTGVIVVSNSPQTRARKQLDLGNKCLADMDYEQAIAAYKQYWR